MSKKKIWIFHHYATPPSMSGLTRPFDFARNLIKEGYECTIFSSSFLHYSGENLITDNSAYLKIEDQGVKFIFLKTSSYRSSKLLRVKNMFDYYKNLFYVFKELSKSNGTPDIIYASSAHPLALLAGQKLSKKYGIPNICEIRDLWPESFVAYKVISKNNPILKLLYAGEKWLYKNADKLIFTMEGGKDYIKDHGWDKGNGGPIDLNKVHHINNGVDLEVFDYNKEHNIIVDNDLVDEKTFKVVYAGSIRKANNLELIVEAAKYVKEHSNNKIVFLIYGDGSEKENLETKCKNENITNVIFKGRVKKEYVPYIVSKADLNILNYSYHAIWKYGGSQNKNFEYLAAGKPILSTIKMGYDILEKFGAGVSLQEQSRETIGESIINFSEMSSEEYQQMCKNARKAAEHYDFKVLTEKLIDIIEDLGVK